MQRKIWRINSFLVTTISLILMAFSLTAYSYSPASPSLDSRKRWPVSMSSEILAQAASRQLQSTPQTLTGQPVVRAIMFWMNGCPHCHEVLENVLPPLQEKYDAQLEIRLVEVVNTEDVRYLHAVAKTFGIPIDRANVPFLIIGDHVLIGSQQIPDELPGLIEDFLAQGGVDWPAIPDRSIVADTPEKEAPPETHADGYAIAIATLALMAAALIYSAAAFALGKAPSLPGWADWLFPVLVLIGLVVAGYLSYVEIQMVDAACGPVGDCNAVQGSPYARLFGFLPVGVMGVTGYIAILAAWMIKRWASGHKVALAALAVFALTLIGVVFSLYLTYLEPFVIKAVCMWCISSAVIMTLLLVLSLPAAINSLYTLRLRRQTAQPGRRNYAQKKK